MANNNELDALGASYDKAIGDASERAKQVEAVQLSFDGSLQGLVEKVLEPALKEIADTLNNNKDKHAEVTKHRLLGEHPGRIDPSFALGDSKRSMASLHWIRPALEGDNASLTFKTSVGFVPDHRAQKICLFASSLKNSGPPFEVIAEFDVAAMNKEIARSAAIRAVTGVNTKVLKVG